MIIKSLLGSKMFIKSFLESLFVSRWTHFYGPSVTCILSIFSSDCWNCWTMHGLAPSPHHHRVITDLMFSRPCCAVNSLLNVQLWLLQDVPCCHWRKWIKKKQLVYCNGKDLFWLGVFFFLLHIFFNFKCSNRQIMCFKCLEIALCFLKLH